jgi:hypothetical protein
MKMRGGKLVIERAGERSKAAEKPKPTPKPKREGPAIRR